MPIVNSSLTEAGIVLHKRVHLGMATALDNGLIVPVIRDAHRKNLLELSREAKDLAARARIRGLSLDELQGATFTVSNLGGYGSVDLFTPIVNPPQAAILGIGRVTDAAVAEDGEIKIRPRIGLSFTYDHRVMDGAVAAEFIRTLMQLLENPARSVLL
jgi:pyruvate dehydrogenase E2 component (dihydrolipoamide acetyltransferase)